MLFIRTKLSSPDSLYVSSAPSSSCSSFTQSMPLKVSITLMSAHDTLDKEVSGVPTDREGGGVGYVCCVWRCRGVVGKAEYQPEQ